MENKQSSNWPYRFDTLPVIYFIKTDTGDMSKHVGIISSSNAENLCIDGNIVPACYVRRATQWEITASRTNVVCDHCKHATNQLNLHQNTMNAWLPLSCKVCHSESFNNGRRYYG